MQRRAVNPPLKTAGGGRILGQKLELMFNKAMEAMNEEISRTPRGRKPARKTTAAASESGGLRDEITMLRQIIRQVTALADEERPLSEMLRILDKLSASCSRLATLLKTERALADDDQAIQAFKHALAEMIDDTYARPGRSGS